MFFMMVQNSGTGSDHRVLNMPDLSTVHAMVRPQTERAHLGGERVLVE
jgi:hypothetical protein